VTVLVTGSVCAYGNCPKETLPVARTSCARSRTVENRTGWPLGPAASRVTSAVNSPSGSTPARRLINDRVRPATAASHHPGWFPPWQETAIRPATRATRPWPHRPERRVQDTGHALKGAFETPAVP